MKKSRLILGLLVLAGLAAIVVWGRGRIHFDFALFRAQLARADWRKVAIAVVCIYVGYLLRSWRWARLMQHHRKVPPLSLLGTQVVGFTAVALLGRAADLTRPYLVSKKTGSPLTTQIAVYIVERLFDAGALAVFITTAILVIPQGVLPHPEAVDRVKHWFLVFTAGGTVFLVAVRVAGGAVASFFEFTFGVISKKLGHAIGNRIRIFHNGLDAIRTFSDLGVAAVLSLVMWFLILLAYKETANAFVANKQLATMSLAKCMIIVACSGGASFFQLPILGWFTQIGLVGEAIHDFFGVAREAAWACSVMLLVDTFLSVLPVGLVWAQFEHVSLRQVAVESEHAGDGLVEKEAADKKIAP
ncbi:MAG: lysylphosphatidylglycerol synthase domain-containing protein [Terracidiphilus sp.]